MDISSGLSKVVWSSGLLKRDMSLVWGSQIFQKVKLRGVHHTVEIIVADEGSCGLVHHIRFFFE